MKVSEILELPVCEEFKLICGKEFLDNTITSAMIFEFENSLYHYSAYAQGSLVLVSYFFAKSNPEFVHDSIRNLIKKQVSAIAIKMMPEETLPAELVQLAIQYHVPIFSFYEMFMEEIIISLNDSLKTKAQYIIHEELLAKIMEDGQKSDVIESLAFQINPFFHSYITSAYITANTETGLQILHSFFDRVIYHRSQMTESGSFNYIKYNKGLLFLCSFAEQGISATKVEKQIMSDLKAADFDTNDFIIGICDELHPIGKLNQSIHMACDSNIVAKYLETSCLSYHKLGIYKYIMTLVNNHTLFHDIDHSISILRQYDLEHESCLYETLSSYISFNGDYAKTSAACYQHTNTIRYRIKKAGQLLSLQENTLEQELMLIMRSYQLHQLIKSE